MRFGVHLPLIGFDDETPWSLAMLTEIATAARHAGYATLAVNDHLVFPRPWLDGPTALAAVLHATGGAGGQQAQGPDRVEVWQRARRAAGLRELDDVVVDDDLRCGELQDRGQLPGAQVGFDERDPVGQTVRRPVPGECST